MQDCWSTMPDTRPSFEEIDIRIRRFDPLKMVPSTVQPRVREKATKKLDQVHLT
jgi:hypothetical protein